MNCSGLGDAVLLLVKTRPSEFSIKCPHKACIQGKNDSEGMWAQQKCFQRQNQRNITVGFHIYKIQI